MASLKDELNIKKMSYLLRISRSGYYRFLKQKFYISTDEKFIRERIKRIWIKSKKTYGMRRILQELRKSSIEIGKKKCRKYMEAEKIHIKYRKKHKVQTTNSKHKENIAPNLLNQNFKVESKDRIWVSDVTFLKCSTSWVYLCVILDLYSRKVVNYRISSNNDSELTCNTLSDAISSRNPEKGLIFHSDRGSNYCSKDMQNLISNNMFLRSNSRVGNCYDNAVAESFFSSLKREMDVNVFYSMEDCKNILFEHIEIFYNRQRSHSYLDYMSPEQFEKVLQ